MKQWLVMLAFLLIPFSALADETQAPAQPATANKVEGPVAGKLPDEIALTVRNANGPLPTVSNMDQVSASFCTEVTVKRSGGAMNFFASPQYTTCQTPDRKLHLAGKRQLTGIHITPDVAGEWRWMSDYSLSFTPKNPWPPGQRYQVQFDNAIFPENVKLTNGAYGFTAEPLKVRVSTMSFLQDPNDIEKRGVVTSLTFNAPVEARALKEHLRFTLQELTDEAKPADRRIIARAEDLPFEIQLNDGGMQANITTPIRTIPDKERFVQIIIQPGLTAKSGGQPLAPGKPGELDQQTRIPSRFDYASIRQVELHIVKNEQYVPEQVLVIQANVPVSSEELARHLKIYQLPKDKPSPAKDEKPIKDYAWKSAAEVTADMLTGAPEVKFSVDPGAEPFATLHSVKIDTEPGRWLYVRVTGGLAAKGDYILSEDHCDTVAVPPNRNEVQILSSGALLSLGGEKKISVYSLGAQKLHYTIERVMNDDISHLVSQTRGDFENPTFENYSFTAQNIAERFSEDVNLPSDDARKPQFSAFDFTSYLTKNPQSKRWIFKEDPKGKGLFFLTVEAMRKDEKGKDSVVATDRRFVLVSDLGLVVKTGSGGVHDVFVQSIKSGSSVSGAKVEVLGMNGLPVITVNTDGDGHAVIPSLQSFVNEKQPVVYVVRDGNDLAFMSYESRGRSLNYSQFDTDGLTAPEEGLRAFLFSDRGVYRPGEDGHIGIVVKQNDWAKNLTDVPLQLEVTNPRGQVVDKAVIKMNAVGLGEYAFSTHDHSPTGIYTLRLYIVADGSKGSQLGSTSVRVEEFLPDTLKITSAFNKPQPKGWMLPEGLKADVNLQHLYGAPAADHRVKASLTIQPSGFSFKEFADYQFFDALKEGKSLEQPIGEARTDSDGTASFGLELGQFGNSTYLLTFAAEGFAQDSGRSVHTASSVLVSSLPYVIGMKSDGNLGYINKKEKRSVQFIAVNSDLVPVDVKNLKVQIAQVSSVSSLIKNEHGAYQYRSIPKETILSAADGYAIPAKGTSYTLDSAKPGNYVLILSDESGRVMHRIAYTIVGEGNMLGHSRKDAKLGLTLDKARYDAADTITMNIISPYTGTGLITLETDKVLAFKWFRATATSSVQTIALPKGFTGKGFVNVQFVRSLDSKEVYTAPLAYHVEPFYVSTASIDSKIALTVPEKAKPGETLTLQYKTKQPGKIVIYAVDEGILQYTRYQTPDPLGYYVNRRALQVETSQILDLLMPEYSIMQALSATGGGDGEADFGKNLNPFKRKTQAPAVFWSGIVDADETQREVHYTIPDYFNGSLRVMAVAVSGQTMGAAEGRTFVQGDIIISPNVPTFAAPGDEFTVGLSVANNIQGSGKNAGIHLSVTPSEHLEVVEGREQDLTVAEGGEAKAQVRVKAKDILGGASLTFTASAAGGKPVRAEETLSVRPPLPSMTALLSGYAEQDQKQVTQGRDLYKEFAAADASVSTLPISLIPGLAQYLERFPYGCTEQTISKAFPAMILSGQKDLGGDAKAVEQSVVRTMSRLRELQNQNGGFGPWWYGGEASDFVSVYALHYMVLAKEKHLPVPDETFRRAQEYARNLVSRSTSSLDQARVQAYGIYLLTRSGVVTANYLPRLLHYLEADQKTEWKQDLTAVYIAAAYRLMQLVPEANALINDFTLGDPEYWKAHSWYTSGQAFYNSLNRYAQYLTIVSDHFPEMLPKLDRNILFRIANFIGEGNYNTLSSSYAIMAFSAYGQASMAQAQAQLAISQQDPAGAWKPLTLTGEQIKRTQLALARGDVRFSGGGTYGLFYQLATDGYDREVPTRPIEDGLEIRRQYLDANHQPVTEVKIGDIVNVVVTLRAHDNKVLPDMAMVDLLPSGFEVVPNSIAGPSMTAQDSDEEVNDSNNEQSGEDSSPSSAYAEEEADSYGQPWAPDAVDVREDRVIAFGVIPSEDVVYHYKIKAVNAGTFTTPPAYVESMYERMVKARGVAGAITVK